MPRTQIRVSLDRAANERLRVEAARRRLLPATLAAQFIQDGLERAADKPDIESPAAALKKWLEPRLDKIRESGGWPPDITVRIFDNISEEAGDLYDAAAEAVGKSALNQELGRMVKERLKARVIREGRRPKMIRVGREHATLIQRATLLEPDDGDNR